MATVVVRCDSSHVEELEDGRSIFPGETAEVDVENEQIAARIADGALVIVTPDEPADQPAALEQGDTAEHTTARRARADKEHT